MYYCYYVYYYYYYYYHYHFVYHYYRHYYYHHYYVHFYCHYYYYTPMLFTAPSDRTAAPRSPRARRGTAEGGSAVPALEHESP